jgi:hypothetical protein
MHFINFMEEPDIVKKDTIHKNATHKTNFPRKVIFHSVFLHFHTITELGVINICIGEMSGSSQINNAV